VSVPADPFPGGDRTSPEPTGPRTVVHLLRHGTVHNPDGILYGRIPGFRLSDEGRAQAEQVAEALAEADVAAVVASPLQRAQETATPIAKSHGLDIVTEDGLIESGNLFEGRRFGVGDGALRRPATWRLMLDPFTPSWGEPYIKIAHRMFGAVHRARALAEGHEAVCVSHQLPIWTLRRYLLGQRLWHDPRSRQCALASLTSVEFTGTTVTGLRYSEPVGSSDPMATGA
jgi:broad specificity phosphatase PhoE